MLDLEEALQELGYGDVQEASRDYVEERRARSSLRSRDRYLDGPTRYRHNSRRRRGIGSKRFWWFLPVQKERHATGAERLEQHEAMLLAHKRAERWSK